MKTKHLLRAVSLLVLLVSFFPAQTAGALDSTSLPPVDLFQLPWDQGVAWMAIDGLDNGTKRPLDSSHHYTVGGAIDFAPHKDMSVGENTSSFWVTAAAAGLVTEKSFCHLKISHEGGWVTEYQFLANVQVNQGDIVYRNQRLGVIANGSTQKFCPGSKEINIPHLHFMLRPTLRNATFAGWEIGYVPLLNKTSFTKNDETLGLFQLLMNSLDLQIVLRGPITWDTIYTGSLDTYRYEKWSFVLSETNTFTLTATSVTSGLVPLLILLDAEGNEITHGAETLTSTQPAGSYFVQVQPQTGNGFYGLLLEKNDVPVPTDPYAAVVVAPSNVNVGETAVATVSLNNIPTEGYTSTEFTCTYDASVVEASNITVASLFGADPAVAISGPQNGSFIIAVAGSSGNKATTGGTAFTFDARGLAVGQSPIECSARVSKGDSVLTQIESLGASLTVGTPPATQTPVPVESPTPTLTPEASPTPTATSTSTLPASDWLTFTNAAYNFQFQYPQEAQILEGRTDNYARINLPFVPGTNLSEKYLEVIVNEGAIPCHSPLAVSSILETSETVVINDITFLKETGQDGTAGHINKWTAYSTLRDNACVSLDFVLRAANPDVFATPIPLYDEAAETTVFGQIVSTYAWLTSPTPTATPDESATPTATPTSTPVESPTPTSTPVTSVGTVTGQVLAGKPVTVSLLNADSTVAASGTVNADGTFGFTVPSGTYTVYATAPGFLSAQSTVTLTTGAIDSLPTITLLAGDIDNNNVIDQFDAMTIGMSYNTTTPAAADLNNDGIINVLDLELLARNYRATGPAAWE
ncbi:MAG: carboxypeptidase regulatory-like domain-containing protein [Anaerolineales bacterium]|nr:carboxypeptidase regulatory-like domain-containing protein [Anaerolineales bacterium]